MSYFTEILAESSTGWRAHDLDAHDCESFEELLDVMRSTTEGDGDVVTVVEHEDDWFALVRLNADEESSVFLSNVDGARESPFADVFEEFLGGSEDFEDDFEPVAEVSDDDEDEDEEEEEPAMLASEQEANWGGDSDIFADRGVSSEDLLAQVEEHSDDPALVVTFVAEAVGFAETLEAVR